jgi:hypothetical protein
MKVFFIMLSKSTFVITLFSHTSVVSKTKISNTLDIKSLSPYSFIVAENSSNERRIK